MSETEKQNLLAAAKRAMEQFRSLPLEEQLEELKRIGILDDQRQLSERYGGPEEHTELSGEAPYFGKANRRPHRDNTA